MRYRDLGISGSRTFIDMTVYDVLYKCCMVIFYMRKTDRFTMVGFSFIGIYFPIILLHID